MKNLIFDYIDKNFPDFYSDIHLRFELGEPYENGSDERIKQVTNRVITLFEEIFNLDANLYVYIKDYEQEDIIFGNTTQNYIYELLNDHVFASDHVFDQEEDEDDDGKTIIVNIKSKVSIINDFLYTLPYKEILKGIANYEQGREPSIGQNVFFINKEEDVIFYMYDDRGCIIYSKSKEKLKFLYNKYNEWLVNYWRNFFDKIFLK